MQSKELSRVFSNPQFKSINYSVLNIFMVQFSNSYMTTGKTIALIRQTFVGKVMSLLFNMLSRLVITFLPRSQLFASDSQSIGVSAPASVLPMITQDIFSLGWTGLVSLLSKGLLRVFSNTTVQKHQFFGAQPSWALIRSVQKCTPSPLPLGTWIIKPHSCSQPLWRCQPPCIKAKRLQLCQT